MTRFDPYGSLWRSGSWPGLARLSRGQEPVLYVDGFRGANGIVDLGGPDLLVSDYWSRRLRLVGKDPAAERGEPRFATGPLPIHPDNLTLDPDRGRVLIAGQRSSALTALNLVAGFVPSPSAVLAIQTNQLGPEAVPTVLWQGGSSHGRSVSSPSDPRQPPGAGSDQSRRPPRDQLPLTPRLSWRCPSGT